MAPRAAPLADVKERVIQVHATLAPATPKKPVNGVTAAMRVAGPDLRQPDSALLKGTS